MHHRRHDHGPRALIILASLIVGVAFAAPASAATLVVQRTFRATFGPGGSIGTATITAYTTGTASSHFDIRNLANDTTYAVRIYDGGCSKVGMLALKLPSLRTDSYGWALRTQSISLTHMNAVWKYALAGPVAIRLLSGTTSICAVLSFPAATRIVISGYPIDLPVIRPPGSSGTFPRCNVAAFFEALSQPGEPGVSLIFAHARTGMFLPLLTASQKSNGAAMLGKTVRVYTSDSKLYTYRIIQVRRHLHSIMSAFDSWTTRLWIQTSEGPYASSGKLVVVASLESVVPAGYAESHPTPHPVVCH